MVEAEPVCAWLVGGGRVEALEWTLLDRRCVGARICATFLGPCIEAQRRSKGTGPGTGPPCEQQRAAKRGRNCRQVFRVPTRRSSRLSRAEIERPPSPATHAHCLACPRVLLRGKGGPGSHVASLDVSCARLFLTRRCFVMRRGRLRDEGAARWRCCEMRLSGPLHWTRSARMHHAEEMQAARMRCDMPLPRLQLASHCSRFAV